MWTVVGFVNKQGQRSTGVSTAKKQAKTGFYAVIHIIYRTYYYHDYFDVIPCLDHNVWKGCE